ncbi:SDR family NAD(P)-dependent oxidoreductase [Flavobacteriaceae bacterium]|nr:SDR family NAD(P)-dependent oxidoreductase [Flavobacteriaceae bacterium]
MMKTALITGASSGIGEAIARLFAKRGYTLILCGRNEERLTELMMDLEEDTTCFKLVFDVRNKEQVFSQLKSIKTIDILINNAGNAHGLSNIQQGDIDDWDAMIDINVKGLLYVTKAILPTMLNNDSGHIINIGSLAAKDVYANGTVYCASKKAVDAITEGMRKDLNDTRIKVGAIHPGLVETNFSMVRFKGDQERSSQVYKGYDPLQAIDIAEIVDFVVSRPDHVNITDLLVLPSAQASSTQLKKDL